MPNFANFYHSASNSKQTIMGVQAVGIICAHMCQSRSQIMQAWQTVIPLSTLPQNCPGSPQLSGSIEYSILVDILLVQVNLLDAVSNISIYVQ